jgi:glutathione S-transferase
MLTSNRKPLKIFGIPFSVHTRKVILTTRLKSIPREVIPVVPVIPDNPPPNWRSVSPTGLIPAIDDNGYVLADSTAIALYLERKHPEPALLPSEPENYGRALFLDAWAGSALFRAVVHPLFHHQVVRPNIHKAAGDPSLAPDEYLVAGKLSIADLAVVSNLIVLHYLGQRIDSARFPRLAGYFQRQLGSPIMRETLEDEKPFVENMGLDRAFLS